VSILDIKGQDNAINWLQIGLQGDRLAHGYIFYGPEGVGKALTARQIAKIILCRNRQEVPAPSPAKGTVGASIWLDSCGRCESCKLVEAQTHPDYHSIYKELISLIQGKEKHKATEIAIDVVRQEVIEKVNHKPVFSDAKVFVVHEAHRLSRSAQNALLKTLEEPPPGTYLILLTDRLSRLLPTIRSRAQAVRFGLVKEDFMNERLAEAGAGDPICRFLAKLVPGQLGLALELFELGVYDLNDRLVKDLAALEVTTASDLAQWTVDQAKLLSEKMMERAEQRSVAAPSDSEANRSALRRLLALIGEFYRDGLKRKLGMTGSWLTNAEPIELIERLVKAHSVEEFQERISDVRQAQTYLDGNVNQGLLLTELFVNLASGSD